MSPTAMVTINTWNCSTEIIFRFLFSQFVRIWETKFHCEISIRGLFRSWRSQHWAGESNQNWDKKSVYLLRSPILTRLRRLFGSLETQNTKKLRHTVCTVYLVTAVSCAYDVRYSKALKKAERRLAARSAVWRLHLTENQVWLRRNFVLALIFGWSKGCVRRRIFSHELRKEVFKTYGLHYQTN